MKKLLYFLAMGWLGVACTTSRTVVDSNSDHLFIDSFNQTYAILESADFTALSQEQQRTIRGEIDRQMQARGYRRADRQPDLYIAFSLYKPDFKLKDWRKVGENERGGVFSLRRTDLKQGTLLMQMVDGNLNRSVWIGYASGLLARSEEVDNTKLQVATRQIFDGYPALAYGYVTK